MSDEERAAAILKRARAERRGTSRTLWIVALVVGVACSIGFLLLMFADGTATTTPQRSIEDRGLGFGAGILVGVVGGIAVGFALARVSARR